VVSRRTAVKGVVGAASLGVFLAGYWGSVEKIIRPATTLYGPDKISGAGVRYVYSSCLGCNVRCGIRVRVASYNGVEVVEKIEGNPYHPYNRYVEPRHQMQRYDALDYRTPVRQSLQVGSTLCPRGLDGIHYLYDPYRVVKPLKRAGPRGSGKWKEISWEQLVKEVVEGGVIEETGERLPGLKEIYVYGRLGAAGFEKPGDLLAEIKKDVDGLVAKAADKNVSAEEFEALLAAFKEKWSKTLGEKGAEARGRVGRPRQPRPRNKGQPARLHARQRPGQRRRLHKPVHHSLRQRKLDAPHTSACQLAFYAGKLPLVRILRHKSRRP
jgi:tetrathionate reductase subunit A